MVRGMSNFNKELAINITEKLMTWH